jgi:hypothetical protein
LRKCKGVSKGGGVNLRFFDADGRARLNILLSADGACGLELMDDTGMIRANLILDDIEFNATPRLCLSGKGGKGDIGLFMVPNGCGEIIILYENRKPVLELPPDM